MRVLMTSQALTPWHGGSAVSESNLASHLSEYCDVTVLCPRGSLDYAFAKSHGVKSIIEYHPRDVFDVWAGKKNWFAQVFERCDVMHINGHWRWENFLFARLSAQRSIPYVLHPRGMCLVGHRRVAAKRLFNFLIGNYVAKNASKVIALSQFEIGQFDPYPIEPRKIEVIPNGIVSSTRRTQLPPVKHLREAAYFLYLGRIESRKGLPFLLRTYAQYFGGGGQARLVLAGPSERGHDAVLKKLAAELGISSSIQFLPPIYEAEKEELLAQAIAVIYPSHEEPFGRVPFETIAAGGFPIIPDQSGSAEYLRSILPSSIYLHENQRSLLEVMYEAEAGDRELRRSSLTHAQSYINRELTWERIAKRVYELYQSVVGTDQHLAAGMS